MLLMLIDANVKVRLGCVLLACAVAFVSIIKKHQKNKSFRKCRRSRKQAFMTQRKMNLLVIFVGFFMPSSGPAVNLLGRVTPEGLPDSRRRFLSTFCQLDFVCVLLMLMFSSSGNSSPKERDLLEEDECSVSVV